MGWEDSIHNADAFRHWLRFALRFGRPFGIISRATGSRQPAARDVLRCGALPPGDGRCRNFRNLRGDLFLVPENVRSHDERAAGQSSFLVYVRRCLLHLYANALGGNRRRHPPLRRRQRRRIPAAPSARAPFYDHRGVYYSGSTGPVPDKLFLEPAERTESLEESVEREDARMAHRFAAASR